MNLFSIRALLFIFVFSDISIETDNDYGEVDLIAAEKEAAHLQSGVFIDYKVGLLHGRMSAEKKQQVMDAFRAGEVQILVSTTVIEVGINVPNATIMLIENAERFGLAQLHQLRGRVGRGSEKSYCILVSDTKTKVAKERMKTMTESEDGFVISEKDLKLRGPGEFFGIRQHGLPELKIADLYKDMAILKEAQSAAAELLKKDRFLEAEEHHLLKEHIDGYLEGKTLEM